MVAFSPLFPTGAPTMFKGATTPYEALLSEAEQLCAEVADFADQTFSIEVHSDFDSLPQAQLPSHRFTPAAYIPSQKVIVINKATFAALSGAIQLGVILHEMGHAVRHRRGELQQFGDCIGADLAVIEWGLAAAIVQAREDAYGPEYGTLLRAAQTNPAGARDALEAWAFKLRSGIISLPTRG